MEFSVADVHEAIAASRPDAECLVFRDRRLTWAQVTERTRRLANHLIQAGFSRGETGGAIPAGSSIVVVGRRGLMLEVEPPAVAAAGTRED